MSVVEERRHMRAFLRPHSVRAALYCCFSPGAKASAPGGRYAARSPTTSDTPLPVCCSCRWSVSLCISLWAATLSLDIVAVKRRMPGQAGPGGQPLGEQRADSAALPVVGDHDGHLGGFGVVVPADEAADRDQAADWLTGVLGNQRHVIAAVHFCQISQLCPAEAAFGGEEAPVHALGGKLPQPVLQEPLVVRADRPDEDLSSVRKALEHKTEVGARRLRGCVRLVTQGRASRARCSTARAELQRGGRRLAQREHPVTPQQHRVAVAQRLHRRGRDLVRAARRMRRREDVAQRAPRGGSRPSRARCGCARAPARPAGPRTPPGARAARSRARACPPPPLRRATA